MGSTIRCDGCFWLNGWLGLEHVDRNGYFDLIGRNKICWRFGLDRRYKWDKGNGLDERRKNDGRAEGNRFL